jgi:exopolysaccharide biosynthesis polyprenyl glycosylphosphotransferase
MGSGIETVHTGETARLRNRRLSGNTGAELRNDLTARSVRQPRVELDEPATNEPPGELVEETSAALEYADRPSPPLRRILIAVDLTMIALGWLVASVVAHWSGAVAWGPLTTVAQLALVVGAGGLLLSAAGLYRRRICAVRSVELARIARVSMGLAVLTVVVLASIGREEALAAGVAGGVAWFLLLAIERGVLREWIQGRRAGGDFDAPILVVGGDAASAARTADFLGDNPVLGFSVRGLVCDDPGPGTSPVLGVPLLGDRDHLMEALVRSRVTGVVLDAGSLTGDQLSGLVHRLADSGLHVHISSGLRGVDTRRISVSPLADETFLHVAPLGLSRRQVVLKRTLDVAGAGLALLLASPVLLMAALATWMYDRGPILFRQQRVGHNGEWFTLFKLRTMVVDAEARKHELEGDNDRSGPLFKLARDPRITPLGRFFRAASIDELPQLINVLEGTMSLVGPRPALPDEVAQFDHDLNRRLTVKPGVTGIWQVEARDLANFDLYRRYDLLYVQNWSLALDLTIITRTVAVVGLRTLRSLVPARAGAATATLE